MSKFYYFKRTFIIFAVGLTVGVFIYGLFDVDFSNTDALLKLAGKSLFTGVFTGVILGIISMYTKSDILPDKENK